MKTVLAAILLLLSPFSLLAQLEPPALGFVLDQELAAIRPILGVAGAARIDAPIDIGYSIDVFVASAAENHILAVSDTGETLLVRDPSGSVSISVLVGASTATDHIVLSPKGRAAALISTDSIHVVADLPDEARILKTLPLPSVYGPLAVTAVSDDGVILVAFSDSGTMYLLEEGGARPVTVFGRVSAIDFLHGQPDALVTDELRDQVFLIRDVAGRGAQRLVADASAGVAAPIAVAASADNRQFFVANGASGELIVLESGKPAVRIPCPCQPQGLSRLLGHAVFGLTQPSEGPMWVLDGDRTFVIPRIPEAKAVQ